MVTSYCGVASGCVDFDAKRSTSYSRPLQLKKRTKCPGIQKTNKHGNTKHSWVSVEMSRYRGSRQVEIGVKTVAIPYTKQKKLLYKVNKLF